MPLDEEGAKWSCEPCIRGHRSSKCQHFDRLMMKVPKAGRPLAKCPHPKGSCSCQRVYAFMVRIPKGSSCVCRPLYQVPADSSETSSASATPGTPTTASNPGRVQKPSRKQSNLQAAPNNIAKALKIEPQQAENDFNVTSMPKQLRSPEKSLTPEQNHQPHVETSTAAPKPGGCCSANPAPAAPAPAPSRSCCSSKEPEQSKEKTVDSAYASWAAPSHMEPLLWNTSLQNGHYSSEAPNYAGLTQQFSSYVSQSDSNSPAVSQTHYMPNMQVGGSFDTISMNQLTFNPVGYPLNIPSSTCGLDDNHDCSCGETCQCLGCASHPYNETTTQHVQKLGFLMSIDEETEQLRQSASFLGPESSPLNMSSKGTTQTANFADNTILPSNFDSSMSPGNAFATDQFMQPSEYYTIEYSVGLSLCSNISGTCQCGNDCNCVGCLTHDGHNGVALEQPPSNEQHGQQQQPQQHQTAREIAPQRWTEYAGYNTNIPRTLDQYSPSALSPPIVEAPFV